MMDTFLPGKPPPQTTKLLEGREGLLLTQGPSVRPADKRRHVFGADLTRDQVQVVDLPHIPENL